MSGRRRWLLAAAAVALLLLLGRLVAGLYADYLWYAAMDATAVWRARAIHVLLLKGLSGLVAALFVFANLYVVRQSIVLLVLPQRVGNVEIAQRVPGRYLVGAAAALSVALGAALTLSAEHWTTLAQVRWGIPFGYEDPYHELDVGFYVYWLPLEEALFVWALTALLVVAAVVVFLYALTPGLRWNEGRLHVSKYVRRHLFTLGALGLLLVAWFYRLDFYGALIAGSGPGGAFTAVDHRARLPVDLWLAVLTLGAAGAVFWFGWMGQSRVAIAIVAALMLLALVVRQLTPVVVRRSLAVQPQRAAGEGDYEVTRAQYTRRAYAIARIRLADTALAFDAPTQLTSHVPIWDPAALALSAVRPLPAAGARAAVGWRAGQAGLLATLSVLAPPDPTAAGRDVVALTRFLAYAADPSGDPIPVNAVGLLAPDEAPLDSVLVFDGAEGDRVIVAPEAGIPAPPLRRGATRLAYAWSTQNFRLLFGAPPPPGAVYVTRRSVRERLEALVPFLVQGSSILPAVAGDTLYWIADLYAASRTFPLSWRADLPQGEYTYFQHAATAFVNAHTGRVMLVPNPARDALAETWVRAFPSLFADRWSVVPAALTSAIPPALDMGRAQAAVLARFGFRGPVPLGRVPPMGEPADTLLDAGNAPVMMLPGNSPLAWTQPVLDREDRVAGLLVAVGGPDRGSRWLPLGAPGPRWSTLLARLTAVGDSALSGSDGRIQFGRVRAVPVADSALYVQPLYLLRRDRTLALARVLVAGREDDVVVANTLAEALGVGAAPPPASDVDPDGAFRARVAALYDQMRAALQRGDLAAFGRAYEALGALLGRPSR